MPACHRDRRGREELRASGQEREHVPVPGGDNAGTGWTPDNGLVSRGVDAGAVCPISGGYRTFASSLCRRPVADYSTAAYTRHKDLRTLSRYRDNRPDLAGKVASLVAAE